MNIDWINEAKKILPKTKALREFFHKNAEIGNSEFKTSEKIESVLNELGIKTYRIGETAVVGLLEVENSKECIAIRSDIDALAIKEETGLDFSSANDGFMHACGHDMHISGALGAAMILANNKEKLKNSVKFLFEPDEEGNGGALRMIDAGCLENPKVSAVYGAHVSPDLPVGKVGMKNGAFYAASNPFNITFLGKSAHAAERDKGNDALAAAAYFTTEIIKLNRKDSVVTVGSFNSGTACNIIADKATLSGTIRTLNKNRREYVLEKVKLYAQKAAEKFGVTYESNIVNGYIGITNTTDGFEKVKKSALQLLGRENTVMLKNATMMTEDFGYFLKNTSGCFYHIGVGGEHPLHSSKFSPDSDALLYLSALHAAVSQE